MKTILLVTGIVTLLLTLRGESMEQPSKKIVIKPPLKYIDSDGKIDFIQSGNENYRIVRQTNACQVPQNRKDSQIDCNLYPNRISCFQTCIFGHTLEEGIQREMKCKFRDNRWEPVPEFELCQPFVDCSVKLGPGGKYTCVTNDLLQETRCKISCKSIENRPAVPTTEHKCDIEGKWTPALPHCVVPSSGMELVAPPRGNKVVAGG